MSKRNKLVVVICIVVAAVSFMGGMIYKYDDYVPLVELNEGQSKYYFEYIMPIEKETAMYWLGWVTDYHTMCLEADPNRNDPNRYESEPYNPYRYHEDALEMYKDIKVRALQFYEKWMEVPW